MDNTLISRKAGGATIEVTQGNTFSLTIDVSGAGSNVSSATMVIKTRTGTAALTLTSSPSAGITISDADTIVVSLTDTQTAALSATWYQYDLLFVLANGSKLTWMAGIVDVIKKV